MNSYALVLTYANGGAEHLSVVDYFVKDGAFMYRPTEDPDSLYGIPLQRLRKFRVTAA